MIKLSYLNRDKDAQDLYQAFGNPKNRKAYIERISFKRNYIDLDPTTIPGIYWQSNPNLNSISVPLFKGDNTPSETINKYQKALQGIVDNNTAGLKFIGK